MTRKYRLERTAFIGCRNTAYMDVDDAEPCPTMVRTNTTPVSQPSRPGIPDIAKRERN